MSIKRYRETTARIDAAGAAYLRKQDVSVAALKFLSIFWGLGAFVAMLTVFISAAPPTFGYMVALVMIQSYGFCRRMASVLSPAGPVPASLKLTEEIPFLLADILILTGVALLATGPYPMTLGFIAVVTLLAAAYLRIFQLPTPESTSFWKLPAETYALRILSIGLFANLFYRPPVIGSVNIIYLALAGVLVGSQVAIYRRLKTLTRQKR